MIRAALVGIGWWGRNLLGAAHASERLRFVHGVTLEPDGVRELAAAHGLRLSTSLDAALADPEVQAVVLATPHSLHREQIERAAAAGKPVLCEKPLALTRADALRAVGACERAGVVLGVGQNKRYWPSMQALDALVRSGELGRVMHVEAHYSNENSGLHFSAWRELPSESPAGGLTGTGIHLLDAFARSIGAAVRVDARTSVFRSGPDPRDTLSVALEFEGGISGHLGAVRASPFYWRFHVFGDEASVEALGETGLVVRRKGNRVERRELQPVDSLRAELEAFADAVEGRGPYLFTRQQMIDTIAMFEAIARSVERGAPVRIAELG
jgi:predicted dehydrogenase